MITIEYLLNCGFKDVSPDKNGLAYRKQLSEHLEVCYYVQDVHVRLQSVGSGFTHSLIGVRNEADLWAFWFLLTGRYITQ